MDTLSDVVIIGAGPSGLAAAIYAARAHLKTTVLTRQMSLGALGSGHEVENYPGIPQRTPGLDILNVFKGQAERFGATVVVAQVLDGDFTGEQKVLYTADGKSFATKTVIIATGARGWKPSIPGEKELAGKGISYCAACDAPLYNGCALAVYGDTDEMLEEMPFILKCADSVTLLTSRTEEELRAHGFFPSEKLSLLSNHRITKIHGDGRVNGVDIAGPDGERRLDVTGVFLYLQGQAPVTDFLHGAVPLTEKGFIAVDRETMATPVPGIFAVGDVTGHAVRQMVTAASEGCIAALAAETFINKRKSVKYQWG